MKKCSCCKIEKCFDLFVKNKSSKDGVTRECRSCNKQRWHIDHIKPCSAFDLTQDVQQKECFHYSNMQPLWAIENHKKGGRYAPAL